MSGDPTTPEATAPDATTMMVDQTGLLLVNLGTPDSPSVPDVRRYLGEFLSDPLVIDLPTPMRTLLVRGIILPFRPKRSAEAYSQIWDERGSPLRYYTEDLRDGMRDAFPGPVAIGMRYGNPSIAAGLQELRAKGATAVTAIPLFPQYSESAWETASRAIQQAATAAGLPVRMVPPFYDHPAFLHVQAARIRVAAEEFRPDHIILSYHGVPERHVRRTDRSIANHRSKDGHCLASATCCDAICEANRDCYRAQCYATSRGLIERLETDTPCEVAFQSRLGRTPWIRPYTDQRIRELAASGRRRLLVACPSFVADCLETIEEIGMAARETFREHGGDDLKLVPCLNAEGDWVEALARIVTEGERTSA